MKEALDAEESYSGIVLNYTKTGTPFWNEVTIRPVQTNGHVEQYIGTVRDVTDKIRLEEAKKKAKIHAGKIKRKQNEEDIIAEQARIRERMVLKPRFKEKTES